MAFVIPAWRAFSTIVLPLASYALSAPFSLLLRRLVAETAVPVAIGHTATEMVYAAVRGGRHSGDLTGTLHAAGAGAAAATTAVFRFHGTRANFSALLLTAIDADRPRGRR